MARGYFCDKGATLPRFFNNQWLGNMRSCFMKSSTKDKIKGAFKEAKGKVKEKTGEATGDPDLRDRGTVEKAGGKVRRKLGDVKKVFEQ